MSTPLETCREWVEAKADRCNQPAVVIVWGKLFPPEALGPKCMSHAANHGLGPHEFSQWAVFDLRGLAVELRAARAVVEAARGPSYEHRYHAPGSCEVCPALAAYDEAVASPLITPTRRP